MDISETSQFAITLLLSVIAWIFPNISLSCKLILILLILLISLFLAYIKQRKRCSEKEIQIQAISKECKTTRQNHAELVKQYEAKQEELARYQQEIYRVSERYRSAFGSVEQLILVTVQSAKSDRLATMLNCFEEVKHGLWGEQKEEGEQEK